jgi:SAM-dependent methyltransferase
MTGLKSFDRVADVYDETRGLPHEAEASIGDAIFAELKRIARPRVVEIGIGTGRIAVPLAERGVAMAGIDISPKMLSRLIEKRRDVSVCLAESANPPFRNGAFDSALFIHILHLVPDVAATVRATLALLRPAGLMIFGRDDEQTGVRETADRAIRDIVREVSGVEMTGWKPYDGSDAIAAKVVEEAGGTSNTTQVAHWTANTTARRHHERLARRDFSSSWEIPDGALPEVVERAKPILRDIYGGWENPCEFPRSFSLTVARLPQS